LIVYQRKPRLREIILLRAGTHKQLFRRRAKRKKK
jgi:mRNA-degrading endonuclease YafQ of YafQ-DinJ toxin-antitoxin module